MIELLQYISCPSLRYLKNQTLWLLDIESRDVHGCVAAADLNDVVAAAHALALFVQHDAIFIENAGLAIDNSARLS